MSRFKGVDFEIKANVKPGEARVVKLDIGGAPQVRSFEFSRLGSGTEDNRFARSQQKFGNSVGGTGAAPASSGTSGPGSEGAARDQKNARFTMNSLVRETLGMDEEQQRVILQRVAEQVAELREEARVQGMREGYQEGLKKGRDEAFAKHSEEAARRVEALESMVGSLESMKEEVFRANERFLMETVHRVTRMVILRELQTDREYPLRLARALVEKVGLRENIRIRVCPRDLEVAGMIKEGLEREFGVLKNLMIEASPQIGSGGCLLETEWNMIDATLDTQLAAIHDSLVGGTSSESPAEGAAE